MDGAPHQDAYTAGRPFGKPPGCVPDRRPAEQTPDRSPDHEAGGKRWFCRPMSGSLSRPGRHTTAGLWHTAPGRPRPLHLRPGFIVVKQNQFDNCCFTLTITYTNFRGMAVTYKVQFLSHLGGDQFDEREDGSDIGGRGGQR